MKDFIIVFAMIAILSIVAFFILYDIVGIIGIEVVCIVSLIIGVTWWLICYKQQELMNEIKDLKKEIKKLEENKL